MSVAATSSLLLALNAVGLQMVGLPPSLNDAPPDLTQRCEDCHTTDGWDVLPEKVAFDHGSTGFPLYGRHRAAQCTDCHGAKVIPEDAAPTCAGCHTDPHRGALGVGCDDCHTPASWAQSADWLRHRDTRFPLVGTHGAADCSSCHAEGQAEPYRGTPTDCFSCHAEDYQRPDIAPDHMAAGFRTTCETCHSQTLWAPATMNHDLFWPLRGAHGGASCSSCHTGGVYGGTSTDCGSCHQNDYVAAKDPDHVAIGMSHQCSQCHQPTGWRPARTVWHEPMFPLLTGAHSNVGCLSCHTDPVQPYADFQCTQCHTAGPTANRHDDVGGYVWDSFACYSCHPDGSE